MSSSKFCLLAFAVLLCSWQMSSATSTTQAPLSSPAKGGNGSAGGKEFFGWVGKALPELVLRTVSCLKRNEKDMKDAVSGLFTDVGKCFDDAKGSVSVTVECLLTNSVNRILDTMGAAQKVLRCTVKKSQDARLCISVTNSLQDSKTCPLSLGV